MSPGRQSAPLLLALLVMTSAWLAGCANVRQGAPLVGPAAQATFEQHHLAQARQQAADGDLAQAAFHWEVLTALRPDVPEYSERLAQTHMQIERGAAQAMRGARQARQQGDLNEATRRYLSVLALQPDNKAAAQALRAIEVERVRREQLGKYSSRQLMPRIPARKPPPAPAATSMP